MTAIAICFMIMLPSALFSQNWQMQRETSSSERFHGMSFVDPCYGWAVGTPGIIYHTDDGGLTWIAQGSNTSRTLFDVCFLDRENGFAVGVEGTIVHTNDGGTNWHGGTDQSGTNYYGVFFYSDQIGWIVGDLGSNRILRTDDGGQIW